MIYTELNIWIAESESWQAHIDFRVNADINNYIFLARPDDFYISLLCQLKDTLDLLNTQEFDSPDIKNEILALAKGLEIFSLEQKKQAFWGVNYSRNILYVATLYYLSDFPATAILLLKQFSESDYQTDIEKFLFYFLSRNFSPNEARNNRYFVYVFTYLRSGEESEISDLIEIINTDFSIEQEKPFFYILLYISKILLNKFKVNNLWHDLMAFGDVEAWKPFVRFNISKNPRIWSFFPSQKEALNRGLLTFDKSFSLQTPTSSGKTSISELVIFNEIKRNPESKVLYLAPFRALASELKKNLARNLSKFGFKIKTIYGGNIVTDYDRTRIEQANVLISTPEKFMAIENSIKGILSDFNLIICDEGHLIDDNSRGISYELLLSRLKLADNGSKKFLFLSAIIPNIEVINAWLGGSDADIAKSDYRPTEIELAYLDENKIGGFDLMVNPLYDIPRKYELKDFLTTTDFQKAVGSYAPTTFKSKAAASGLKAISSGAVAIFASTKTYSQGVAGIAEEILKFGDTNLPKPIVFADSETVELLSPYFEYIFGAEYLLCRCLTNGFIFHHGDLPQFIREILEDAIRHEKIRLVICTTTIAEGVNLPIKTMVISSAKRFSERAGFAIPLDFRNLKNLIGRTGRAGKESKGTIIVVNPKDRNILDNVFLNRNLEDVKGFLFYVVRFIENYIKKNATSLSNELLDQLEQSDYIDDSIIQLLSEDINGDNLSESIKNLVEGTLTFYQADANLKKTLHQLFNLRSEKVLPMLENGKINEVRTTGIPLRLYDEIEKLVNFQLDFLAENDDPLSQEWFDYLFGILSKINPVYESKNSISAIKIWMSGGWYSDMASALETSVDEALFFCQSTISYQLQNDASRIIKYIEMKRSQEDLETSSTIIDWPNYLIYGLKTKLELDLTELGIPDRILAISIAEWLNAKNAITYANQTELRQILSIFQDVILEEISPLLPQYSINSFANFMKTRNED